MGITTSAPTIASDGDRTTWSVDVTGSTTDQLWFNVPVEHEELLSERADAALAALLLPAMRAGQDLHIRGAVTDELLRWTNTHAQHVVVAALHGYEPIKITADEAAAPPAAAQGVAMGFSAGVDSFAALDQLHLQHDALARQRLTHLLFNNVGSHGDHEPAAGDFFRHRLVKLRPVAEAVGLPLVDVDSNVHAHFDLYPDYTNVAFDNTHTLRNIAVAFLLSGGVGRWYYASSGHLNTIQMLRPTAHIATADMLTLTELSTSHLPMRVANIAETRVAKTRRVATLDLARRHLDVCISLDHGAKNCSSCWKCMRTQAALDMLGHLEDFSSVFDLDVYRAHRDDYAVQVLASKGNLDLELQDLAREVGWEWPPVARLKARALRAREGALDAARTVKRRIRR